MTKVHIWPAFAGEDLGDGGIRRVWEGQVGSVSQHGIEVVAEAAGADVLACHIEVPTPYVLRFPEKAIVAHCHGLYWAEYEWENWAIAANAKVMEAIRLADIVTAPSEWVAEAIRRHTVRDVRVVPHGVDAAAWTHRDKITDAVLAVLAGADENAARLILDGAPYVLWNKNRPDAVCDPVPVQMLAGRLPDVQFVSTFGEKAANLTITGRQPFAVAREFVECAGVYLCITRETFGVGTLEALAAGVPVVGWAWGGQVDIIEHGVDGWLAAPGDFDGLVEGIRWALANRAELAPACRAKAAQYSWDRAGAMYAAIYEEAAGLRVRGGRIEVRATGGPTYSANVQDVIDQKEEWLQHPRVSVIVTAYKLARYLPDTLDSVAAQTARDWECIVVDDASPDECGAIAESYAERDPRFRVIHNATNQYLAGARNTAIAQARGAYVIPLDADDMLKPETLEVLAGELDRQRAIDVAYGGVLFVNEDGRTPTDYGVPGVDVGHSRWPVEFRHEWQLMPPAEQSGGRPPNLLPYCSMYRRRAWTLTGGYRTRLRTAEDADFWCRLSSYGFRPKKVTTIDTLIYRNRDESMSRREEVQDWSRWFPWARDPRLTPAGAGTEQQLPVPSCDPPAISVIIPVGPGHGEIVMDALDSLDAQTFRQWECIVINDTGAPLPRPLPAWAHVIEPLQIVDKETTQAHGDLIASGLSDYEARDTVWPARFGGVAAARNAGIRASRAKLFLPLDADDLLEPHALQALHEDWERTGDIIYPDFWEDPDTEGQFSHWTLPDYDPRYLITGGSIHSVTALTPRTAWEAVGGYDEELVGWEDWGFQLSCAERCICTHRFPEPLFTYRKWTGNRREENYANFEESKAGIVAKFGDYWNGGKEMGGCGSCGGGRGSVATEFRTPAPPSAGNSDAVLLRYVGPQEGATLYSSTVPGVPPYSFGHGDERYVLVQDMPKFAGNPNFAVVQPYERIPVETGPAPALQVAAAKAPEPAAPPPAAAPDAPPAEAWGPAAATADAPDVPSVGEGVDLASLVPKAPLPSIEEAMASPQTQDLPGTAPPPAAAPRRTPSRRGAASGRART